MAKVTIYTVPWCGFCTRALRLLSSKGVEFQEVGVGEEPKSRAALIGRTGHQTFPQIFIDDLFVGGSDELYSLERSGRLDALLF